MPRNFFRRIEVAFPIEDGNLRERVIREILATSLADNVKARWLHSDGSYTRAARAKGEPPRRSQTEFIERTSTNGPPTKAAAKGRARYPRVKLVPSPFKPRAR